MRSAPSWWKGRNGCSPAIPMGHRPVETIYSLIETAKANGLQAYHYLQFLFEQLPLKQSDEDYKNILPQYVDREKNRGRYLRLGAVD